ncbi:helix-turn-helix DNA binding domain protein [Streptomyces phage Satis]|nr:helix-turn-helix DNA binding domain protein [Streptomyces phage Satis]QBZ71982.1 helix-turn-helix DNA binding domain protein [Streptomyces phage Kradal]QPL14401.1 helix-tun-helix DNA binding domain protein [Streptomyces phage EhyElimayoE]
MKSTGETISQTVENLLAIRVSEDRESLAGSTVRKVYTKKLSELADHLGVSDAYLPRKIKAGSWDAKEIDQLADFFEMWPGDFVPGPGDEKME